MNLTPAQIIGGAISTLGVLAGATSQMTILFGQTAATDVATVCTLASAILGGWIVAITGQAAQIRAVAAMPGVERVAINEQANSVAAKLATDPDQPKVGATTPDVRAALQTIAKGG